MSELKDYFNEEIMMSTIVAMRDMVNGIEDSINNMDFSEAYMTSYSLSGFVSTLAKTLASAAQLKIERQYISDDAFVAAKEVLDGQETNAPGTYL